MERVDITAIEKLKDIADNCSVIATIKTRSHGKDGHYSDRKHKRYS